MTKSGFTYIKVDAEGSGDIWVNGCTDLHSTSLRRFPETPKGFERAEAYAASKARANGCDWGTNY